MTSANPQLALQLRLLLPISGLAAGFSLGFIQLPGLLAGVVLIGWLLFAQARVAEGVWTTVSLLGCLALAATACQLVVWIHYDGAPSGL